MCVGSIAVIGARNISRHSIRSQATAERHSMIAEPGNGLLSGKAGERCQQIVVGRRRVEIVLEVLEQEEQLNLREPLHVAVRNRKTVERDRPSRSTT